MLKILTVTGTTVALSLISIAAQGASFNFDLIVDEGFVEVFRNSQLFTTVGVDGFSAGSGSLSFDNSEAFGLLGTSGTAHQVALADLGQSADFDLSVMGNIGLSDGSGRLPRVTQDDVVPSFDFVDGELTGIYFDLFKLGFEPSDFEYAPPVLRDLQIIYVYGDWFGLDEQISNDFETVKVGADGFVEFETIEPYTPVPEPVTILGSLAAIGFGVTQKKRRSK